MSSGHICHRWVDSSTSAKSNVTVPVGGNLLTSNPWLAIRTRLRGERTHIGQHLVEPHSSGANGTGDPAILAQIYDPGDALCACWRMIFAPQDRMVDVDVGRKAVMNCVEEHDTCLTTAITSSQHLRGAAKPISTLQFGKTPGPSSKQASRSDVHYRPKRLSSALHGGRSRRPAGCYRGPRPTAHRSVSATRSATDSWSTPA